MNEMPKRIYLDSELDFYMENHECLKSTAYIREDLVDELVKALELALNSHGVMLMSDPPQDAWKAKGVEWQARAALAKARGESHD